MSASRWTSCRAQLLSCALRKNQQLRTAREELLCPQSCRRICHCPAAGDSPARSLADLLRRLLHHPQTMLLFLDLSHYLKSALSTSDREAEENRMSLVCTRVAIPRLR